MTKKSELETWKNATAGIVVVKRVDERGREKAERVMGGREIALSPDDRRLNQNLAYDSASDVFSNGTMQPVKILEDHEDAAEIASNPNHISEDDMRGLVKGHHKTLESRLEKITNPGALQNMLKIAQSEDATLSTIGKIEARLEEVAPSKAAEIQTTEEPISGPGERPGVAKSLS